MSVGFSTCGAISLERADGKRIGADSSSAGKLPLRGSGIFRDITPRKEILVMKHYAQYIRSL
jgi:hypothetical protein